MQQKQTGQGTTAAEAVPSASASQWLAVAGVALGTFILVTNEFLPVGLLPQISAGLRVTAASSGLLVTAPGLVAAIAAPSVSVLLGRLDRRIILLGMTVLFIAADLLSAVAPNLVVLVAARLVFGLGIGGFWAIGATVGPSLVGKLQGGRATALIFGGISIASVVGVPLGTALGQTLGWRAAFLATAIVGGIALMIQGSTLPRVPASGTSTWTSVLHLVRSPRGRTALIATVILVTGQFVAFTYLVDFLHHSRGITNQTISLLLLAYGLAGLIGNFAVGPLLRSRTRVVASVLALTITAAALTSVSTNSTPLLLMAIAVWGAAYGGVPITMQTLVRESDSAAFESGAPLYITSFQGAIAIGSVAGAAVVAMRGDATAIWAGALLALIAAITTLSRSRPPSVPSLHGRSDTA